MTLSIFIKLLLFLVFIPLAYAATWGAQRWLAPGNPLRKYVERNGKEKVARHILLTLYVAGGVALTILYS
jgi:hypothetical protein